MLKMTVREQRDTLKMRLQEVQQSSDVAAVGPAVNDVEALLVDVDAAYGFKQ
jgi:hypothetical protein